jgi:hypothetical protein
MNNLRLEVPGIATTLFIVFLVLKLTNAINWSWWWVTSPLWISAIISVIVIFITLVILKWVI